MRGKIFGGLAALVLVGCGSADFASGSASAPQGGNFAAADVSGDAGGHGGTYAAKDAASGGTATPSVPATTAGGGVAGDDNGIGLKPGGAQDIAFFRMKVAGKQLPKAADMTIEGWLNEHDTVLPPALKDRTVTLHALAAVVQDATAGEAVLQIGLNSGKTLAEVTDKVALTLVIDRSGSMQGEKMTYVKAGLHALVQHLPAGTRLTLVSFSTGVTTDVAPEVVSDADKAMLDQAIDQLVADGGTNLYGGLQKGLEHCKSAGKEYKFRRVLVMSDGVPTEGDTDKNHIEALAGQAAAAGCSVSTVGVGFDFDPQLMTHMAQKGNGTAWFVQDASHAQDVFVQDLETMLLPVAEQLTLGFQMAEGWKVADIYGFDWVEKDGVVTVTGPKQAPADPNQPDPGKDPPETKGSDQTAAMPTLFASKRNGLVMVKVLAPAGTDLQLVKDLKLATVKYGYKLAKQDTQEQFEVPVQVPGVVQVPDAGVQYFASPIVERAWLVLHTGLDLIDACKLAEAGQNDGAKKLLDAAVARLDLHQKLAGAPLVQVDQSQPDLADARQLLLDVAALLGAQAKP